MRILLYLTFIVVFSFACSPERKNDNIFDPNVDASYKKPKIGFSISTRDSAIMLSWLIPSEPHVKGFNIYRKTPGTQDFSLYKTLNGNVDLFKDPDIIFDQPYYYYLTLIGDDVESAPTDTLNITAGPGNIWLLDSYNWEALNLSYDLSTVSLTKYTDWSPKNLVFAHNINKAMIISVYYNFGDLEIFDLTSAEVTAGNYDLDSPYDAVYDRQKNLFWLVDSTGLLYEINPSSGIATLTTPHLKKPVQIALVNNRLIILNSGFNNIQLLNTSPAIVDSITDTPQGVHFTSITTFRTDAKHDKLYLLDKSPGSDNLYKYDLSTKSGELIYSADTLFAFDIDSRDETIWIARSPKLNSELLQLSASGQRLHSTSGFQRPTDLKVNPYNGNVILVDSYQQKVFHYRADLSLVGVYESNGIPIKVYIE